MKKKIILITSIILVCVLTSICFLGCSSNKTDTLIEEKRTISSIVLNYKSSSGSNTLQYSLDYTEIVNMVQLLDEVGEVKRQYLDTDTEDDWFDYVLVISLEKTWFKKATSYYIYVGRHHKTYNIFSKDYYMAHNEDYLRLSNIKGITYYGNATTDLLTELESLAEKAE